MADHQLAPLLLRDEFYDVFQQQLASHKVLLAKVQIKELAWINSQFGAAVGDAVIGATKEALQAMTRSYVVGEISPTTYGILCQKAEDPKGLLDAIDESVAGLNQNLKLPCHVELAHGVVVADPDISENLATWTTQANTALMVSAISGRGRIYLPSFETEQKIRSILGRISEYSPPFDGLTWNFQPVVRVEDGELVGFEALARWDDPELGIIAPDVFIPIAEELGVIRALDFWAAGRAISAIVELEAKYPGVSISANASAMTLVDADNYIFRVAKLLKETGLKHGQFVVELTESCVIKNVVETAMTLKRLKALGVHVAIDDFGHGETNLANLVNLPFDFLKLDKSLLHLPDGEYESSMLRIGADIGRVLGAGTLAEGVETQEDLALVKAAGIKLAQGFYFGRPMPLEYYLKHA